MARSSLKLRFREILRPFPLVQQIAKAFQRFSHKVACDLLRLISPRSSYLGIPKGFYSGVSGVRDGDLIGEVILESQTCPPFPRDSLVKLCRLGQDTRQPWPLFWIKIPNVLLCGRSLVPRDSSGHLLAEATFSQTGDVSDPSFTHFATGEGQLITGNATSIVSRWGGDARGNRRYGGAGYWHWLFDSVTRLSLMDRFPADTKVITPPLTPWMRWFLERLNLDDRIMETDATALRVEHFYFSSPSSMTGCWNPYAVNFLRQSFLPFGSPPSDLLPKRFYILREGYTRKIANELDLRELFTSLRWALIAPEKLSMPDQIALFRDAEAIAGLHGSALTNLIWSSPGTSVLEFVPECFMSGAFEWLSLMNQLSHRFLLCQTNNWGETVVNLSELAKIVEYKE